MRKRLEEQRGTGGGSGAGGSGRALCGHAWRKRGDRSDGGWSGSVGNGSSRGRVVAHRHHAGDARRVSDSRYLQEGALVRCWTA